MAVALPLSGMTGPNVPKSKACAFCSATGDKNRCCGKCYLVWYCSAEHQRKDWKNHRVKCHPFKVTVHPQFWGKVLVATRDIKEGEIILEETALITSPYSRTEGKDVFWGICLGCCKLLTEKFEKNFDQVCERCAWPLCKRDCRELKNHADNECGYFEKNGFKPETALQALKKFDQRMSFDIIYEFVKVLRCLLLQEKNPAKYAKLIGLESNVVRRRESVREIRNASFVFDLVHDYLKLNQFGDKLVDVMLGIVATNAIPADEEMVIDGARMCSSKVNELSSMLSHSCVTNTQAMQSDDGLTRVQSVCAIKSGQILTQTLQHHKVFFEDIVQRREYLHNMFFFWCNCLRCQDPTELGTYSSGIKCQYRCHGRQCDGYFLPSNPLNHNSVWRCSNRKGCGQTKCYNYLHDKYLLPIKEDLLITTTMEGRLDILKSNAGVTVHENHAIMLAIRCKIMHPLSRKVDEMRSTSQFEAWNNIFNEVICKADQIFDLFGLTSTVLRGVIHYYKSLAVENKMLVLGTSTKEKQAFLREAIKCQERALRIFEQSEMREGSMACMAYHEIRGKIDAFKDFVPQAFLDTESDTDSDSDAISLD